MKFRFIVMSSILVGIIWLSGRAWSKQIPIRQAKGKQVSCFFIFGDSLVDNGNNNGLVSLAKANYMPYGIDFPQGTTGRFTNGLTFVDVLAELLGFPKFIPPYASTKGPALLMGVNFASGASGIRDETGNNLGHHLSMNQQVSNFGNTVQQMRSFFKGNTSALNSYLNKCIFYSGMGSNDYLNNYFMPNFYTTSSDYTSKAYAASLLRNYTHQLTQLYILGARKVIVTGIGKIGCIPYQLARFNGNNSQCNEEINKAILMFNSGLRKLVDRFNHGRLPGSNFVYLNSYKNTYSLYQNATSYGGFQVIDKGCCGVGRNNGQITCLPLQKPCDDRNKYLFWDAFHPTEAANIVAANAAYNSKTQSYAYPINIHQLAML